MNSLYRAPVMRARLEHKLAGDPQVVRARADSKQAICWWSSTASSAMRKWPGVSTRCKEQPITTGILIQDGRIEQVRILVYRESRGGEVRYPAFTRQFEGAGLSENQRLDRTINGISGATLSVNALERMTRLALFLEQKLPAE